MKTTIAITTLIISLLGARLTADDALPTNLSVEQQFQQADVMLAIEQYKRFRMAGFDLTFKLNTKTGLSEDERKQLELMRAQLDERAEELRARTIKAAAVADANTQ